MDGSVAWIALGVTLAATFGAATFGARAAYAGDWTITPRVGAIESFSDNVNGLPRGQAQSDFYTTVTPGISVRGTGARLKLALDYSAQKLFYHRYSNLDRLNHNLNATGTMTVLPEHLFVDAQSSISQQTINSAGTVSAVPGAGNRNNTTTVKTFSISPYWRSHFGSFADAELRYGFNDYLSGTSQVADNTSHTFSAQATSGYEFTRLLWLAQATDTESHLGSSTQVQGGLALSNLDSSHRLVQFAPEYVINRFVSVLGNIGWEQIDDPTLVNRPVGLIGSAGIRLHPGPRTVLTAKANHRFNRNFFTGDAAYKIGATSTVTASYSEDIQSSQSQTAQDLSFLTTDEFGNFIDRRTAQQFQIGNAAFNLSSASYTQKRFETRFNYALGRNHLGALGFNERRFTELTGITERNTGVSLNFGRELTPVDNLNLTLRYLGTNYGTSDGRKDSLYGGGTGLVHRFSDSLQATVDYNILVRNSNLPNNGSVENVVSVGLLKSF